MADNTPPRKVTLRGSTRDIVVEEAVAKQSPVLKRIIEQPHYLNASDILIVIPDVTGKILTKVFDYCAKHVAASATATTSGGMGWREKDEFVRSLKSEPYTLMAVIAAASYLEIKSLLDLLRTEFAAEVEVALKSSVEAEEFEAEEEVALKSSVEAAEEFAVQEAVALKSSVEAEEEFAVEEVAALKSSVEAKKLAVAHKSQTTPKKMVTLKSSDEVEFVVEEAVAIQSQTIKNFIINNHADFAAGKPKPIYLGGSTSRILSKVIEYCEKHARIATATAKTADKAEAANVYLTSTEDCWTHVKSAIAATTLEEEAAEISKAVTSLRDAAKIISATSVSLLDSDSSPSSTEGGGGEGGGDEIKVWDAEFVKGMEANTLFDVVSAAIYLDIKGLLELCCEAVAEITRDKTPVETRKMFAGINKKYNIRSQIKLMKKHKWSFD